MNTKEHLDGAQRAIQDFEETDKGRAQLDVTRKVYNLLVDAEIAYGDGFTDTAFENIANAWEVVHGAQAYPELEHILVHMVRHANFVKAYGMEHDK